MKILFNPQKYTALLPVEKNKITFQPIEEYARVNNFIEKEELHITLIGFKTGKALLDIRNLLAPEMQGKFDTFLKDLLEKIDWNFKEKGEYHHMVKKFPNGDTCIEFVLMPEIEFLYRSINEITGQTFETPPPHITLFTKGTDPIKSKMGIGIYSQADFESYNPQKII